MKGVLVSVGLIALAQAVAVYEQCSSTAICDSGLTCVKWSASYSQCLQVEADGVQPVPPVTVTVTATVTTAGPTVTQTATVTAPASACTGGSSTNGGGNTTPPASDDTPIFVDNALATGWQDWSWDDTVNYGATDLFEGETSISVNLTAYGAFSLKGPELLSGFSGVVMDIAADPSTLQIYFQSSADSTEMTSNIELSTLGNGKINQNSFTTISIPFTDFGNATYDRINIQALANGAVFHLDNIELTPLAITVTDIYTDGALDAGWEDWSWDTTIDYASTTLFEGTSSIFVNATAYGAFSLKADSVTLANFSAVQFDIAADPSTLQVYFQSSTDTTDSSANIALSSLSSSISTTAFTTVTVPFTDFIKNTYDRINIQALGVGSTFYLDNIELLFNPADPTPTSPPASTSTPIPVTCPTEGRTKFEFFGVSESGAEFGTGSIPGVLGTDYTWPSTDSIDFFLGKGFNTFRVTFLMERMAPLSTGVTGPFDATYLGGLTNITEYITSKGGFALIDPHNYMRYNGSIIAVDDFATFWTNLSTVFKNNSNIVFDLQNEPNTMPASDVFDRMQAAITAIRAAGATSQLILVEGTSWTGAWTWTTTSGNGEVFGAISDPNNNTAIEMHQYLDSDGSGTNATCVSSTIGSERIADATAWLQQNGLRGFLGEMGGGSNDDCVMAVQGMLCDMQQANGTWIGALWWAAGPWWGSYFMSIEPPSGASIARILPEALEPFL